jgi:hypothetical protein
MINFQVHGLTFYLVSLSKTETDLAQRIETDKALNNAAFVPDIMKHPEVSGLNWREVNKADLEMINGSLKYATTLADRLELQSVHDRIEIFSGKLRYHMTLHDFVAEVRALREAFEAGLRFKYFYVYPTQSAQKVLKFLDEWDPALKGFPGIGEDGCWEASGTSYVRRCLFQQQTNIVGN